MRIDVACAAIDEDDLVIEQLLEVPADELMAATCICWLDTDKA